MTASDLRRDGPCWTLVAAEDLAPGVLVAHLEGPVVPWEAVLSSDRGMAFRHSERRWLVPSGVSRHLGRAVVPNCSVSETLEVVTLRSTSRGEELTIRSSSLWIEPERRGEPGSEPPLIEGGISAGGTEGLRIAVTAGKGRGVFACRTFSPGELIERAPVLELPSADWSVVAPTRLSSYCFRFGPDPLDAAIALGYGSLYNHSYRPSAYYLQRLDAAVIDFIALRRIDVGDEVTVNYDGTPESDKPVWFDVVE
jgi:hypothetical protein